MNGSDKVTVSSTGASVTGNLAVTGTVDGVDIATRDGTLTSTTTTANAALPKAGGTMTGALTINQSTAATPSLTVRNNGGHANNAVVAKFYGDTDGLEIVNFGAGDYKIVNPQQDNGISIYDGTAGVKLFYNGTDVVGVTSAGLSVTSGDLSVTNNITVGGTVDGVDIQTLNTTAGAALPKAGGTMTGALRHDQNSASASGGTLTPDLSAANNFYVTISAATTFAFSNKDAGRFGNIIIKQNATGGYSFTLPSECKTPVNGASIVQSTGANEISILAYYVVDSSNILVNYIGDFA